MSTDENFVRKHVIKDLAMCTPEYVERLRSYLREHASEYFGNKDNQACAWNDFDYFNKTTDRDHLVMPDEVLLIDRDWKGKHTYVICRVSENKVGQKCKDLIPVLEVSDIPYGDWKNGYFLLPLLK